MKCTTRSFGTCVEFIQGISVYATWLIVVIIICETASPNLAGILIPFSFMPFVPCIIYWLYKTHPETNDANEFNRTDVVAPGIVSTLSSSKTIEVVSL